MLHFGSHSSDDAAGGCSTSVWLPPTTGPMLLAWGQNPASDVGSRMMALPWDGLATGHDGSMCQWAVCTWSGLLIRAAPWADMTPFYWTSMDRHTCGWTAIGGSFHWALSHLTPTCLSVSRLLRFPRDRRQPPAAVVGPFLAGSGGACTYAKPSGPCWRSALSTYRGLAWWA